MAQITQLNQFFGGARRSAPIPRTSGLYANLTDPSAVQQNNDLRDYKGTGQSLAIPIRNQGHYGACTGFAGTAVRAALTAKYHLELGDDPDIGDIPSARYAYLRTRQLDGDPNVDQGASMESACRVYPLYGVAPARFDPWNDAKAAVGDLAWLNHTPTAEAEAGAQFFGASGYARLSGTGQSLLASVLQCLAEGYPPLVAFGVPQSFENVGSSGKIPTPGSNEQSLGGHANAIFASFADRSFPGGGCLLTMNSWGTGWGENGWGYMPWSWFTTLIPGTNDTWMWEAWTVR
jgi:hypothetical protein